MRIGAMNCKTFREMFSFVTVGSESLFMNASLLSRITIEPGKCGGKPCIRGMRIRVSDILEMLGDGVSMEEVLVDFPDLERDDILASLQFAARRSDIVHLAA